MKNDAELLTDYVKHGSEADFTELVARHIPPERDTRLRPFERTSDAQRGFYGRGRPFLPGERREGHRRRLHHLFVPN